MCLVVTAAVLLAVSMAVSALSQTESLVRISIQKEPLRVFRPADALGLAVDGGDGGTTDRLLRPDSLRSMRSLGLPLVAYRLRTELGIEAWHWNEAGRWSSPALKAGYWTSEVTSNAIRRSWGYRLPRRGMTIDQANNDGYSRLADGNAATFWKSNPYLASHFTGDPDEAHPQWVVVDFGRSRPIDAVRLQWAAPFAVSYRLDYCEFEPETDVTRFADTFLNSARWRTFPHGRVDHGTGGDVTLQLSDAPIRTRFVRVWMTRGSHTSMTRSADVRDSLGYALREIGAGCMRANGSLMDWVRHAGSARRQSRVYVSSTDPWHTSADRDTDTEQPGVDCIVSSGLHSGRPIMMAVGLLYDTPENAVALLRTLRKRRVPVTQVELGEEPDGQCIEPEDYGALYVRWARALHSADPSVSLGGPSLQTTTEGWRHWPNAAGDTSWMRRFLCYLKRHDALNLFSFFSFEWYPFDDLRADPSRQLRTAPVLMDTSLRMLEADGVPRSLPWVITEFGWSAYATRRGVDLPGAFIDAGIVAQFLARGGAAAYLYGAVPGALIYDPERPGSSWGGVQAFLSDDDGRVRASLPTARVTRLITGVWMQEGAADRAHELYTAHTDDSAVLVSALRRPDGRWSVLLINSDARRARRVLVPADGNVDLWEYGPRQFRWANRGPDGRFARNLPPVRGVSGATITLPPFSMAIAQWSPGSSRR